MKSKSSPKFLVGDYVTINRVFTPAHGGGYDYSHGEIIAKIIRVDGATSLGYSYELKSIKDIFLGGVMYWENELKRYDDKVDCEEEMWKTWGDH